MPEVEGRAGRARLRALAIAGLLIAGARAVHPSTSPEPLWETGTLSILGFDPATGEVGAKALALLRAGLTPEAIVKRIWEQDPDPLPDNWSKQGRIRNKKYEC